MRLMYVIVAMAILATGSTMAIIASYPPATMVGAAVGRIHHDVRLAEGWVRIVVNSDPIAVTPFRGCDYFPLSPTPAEPAESTGPIKRRGNEVPAWIQSMVDAPLPPAGSGRYIMAVSYGWPIPVVGYRRVEVTLTSPCFKAEDDHHGDPEGRLPVVLPATISFHRDRRGASGTLVYRGYRFRATG